MQIKNTESAIRNKQKDLLTDLRGFKFVKKLVLQLKKQFRK